MGRNGQMVGCRGAPQGQPHRASEVQPSCVTHPPLQHRPNGGHHHHQLPGPLLCHGCTRLFDIPLPAR